MKVFGNESARGKLAVNMTRVTCNCVPPIGAQCFSYIRILSLAQAFMTYVIAPFSLMRPVEVSPPKGADMKGGLYVCVCLWVWHE